MYRKYLAVILSVVAIISLTACKANEDGSVTQESTTVFDNTISETVEENVSYTETTMFNETSENYVQEDSQGSTSEVSVVVTETEEATTGVFDNPSDWSKKRIIEEYKKAAIKSNPTVKSTQKISIKEMSVNDGEYESAMSFIKTIISKFLESNSTEKEGITGGFENLVPQDVNSARAYKDGNNIVIEMLMVEQTSGAKEDALSGSVGHAITAVGDIDEVIKDLADRGLPLELSEEDTKIYYTNPVVEVVINENGEIISGTWSYTVEISMNNFKAFGQTVEKAKIVMDNIITV